MGFFFLQFPWDLRGSQLVHSTLFAADFTGKYYKETKALLPGAACFTLKWIYCYSYNSLNASSGGVYRSLA